MLFFWTGFVLVVAVPCVPSLPPIIKIGAIFSEAEKGGSSELAFRYAVHRINRDKYLLPHTQLVYDIQYVPLDDSFHASKKDFLLYEHTIYDIQYVPLDDSFHASKKACQQVQFGVQAMFGPSDPMLGPHIHSVCDALDIPHIEARLDLDQDYKEFSINLYPSPRVLNTAYQDIIRFLNWTKLAIVYENDYGLIKLRDLDRSPSNKNLEIHLMQAEPDSYRDILKTIKTKEIQNLIVDTKPENINEFLKGILQLQMNDYKFHYLFTSFDIETFDLEDFKYNFVNMTAFRLVDASDITIREILRDMDRFRNGGKSSHNVSLVISSDAALMYDAVYVFAVGLQTLEQSHSLQLTNLSCEEETPWDAGLSLINYVNSVEIKGLTGPIEFKEGKRVDFKMDLLKLKQHSLVKVGEWETGSGVNISDPGAFFDSSTMNVTLVVVTILEAPYMTMFTGKNYTGNGRFSGFCVDLLESISRIVGFDYIIELVPDNKYGALDPATGEWNGIVAQLIKHETPYVMHTASSVNLTGNARYEGFCIDLLRAIAGMVGFEYSIQLVPDGKYGVFDYESGEWNGIVRQLMDKKADLAVGSMTINYARESVIDFTKPFMNLGISILFKIPTNTDRRILKFLAPLSADIWLAVAMATILAISTLSCVARLSYISKPRFASSGVFGNNRNFPDNLSDSRVFTLSNCVWFVMAGILRQDAGLSPQVLTSSGLFVKLGTLHFANDVPTSESTRLFSFMNPLAVEIWFYVLAAYILVSITMFIVARFSPYEWHNPHPCDVDNDLVQNQFSMSNSFWFTIGTLMQQGSLNPKATSTRIVGGIWWFFTLIIISSYTANLAAFLTVERMITPIENAEDLAGQTEISYGTLESGSTMTFFRVCYLSPIVPMYISYLCDFAIMFADLAIMFADLAIMFADLPIMFADLAIMFADFAIMFADLAIMFADFAILFADFAIMFADFVIMFADLAILFADLAIMFADFAILFVDFAIMLADFAIMFADFAIMFADQDDSYSKLMSVNAGVPQGSVLGPMLYLLFTSDIPENSRNTIATFADDTAFLTVGDNTQDNAAELNVTISEFHRWTNVWRIKLNESKSVHIDFTNRNLPYMPVYLNNVVIPHSNQAKYLGMTLDVKLKWID
ncbi:hypothetical protein M8J77_017278 [Diaphorina citri]|nr:hypothetical protein M8J77_017278 [Diaphorina citri]